MRRFALSLLCLSVALIAAPRRASAEDLLPKHVTPQTLQAVKKGLDYLAKTQSPDGNWPNSQDGRAYPVSMASLAGMAFLANGNTPTRGPYAENVRLTMQYVMSNARGSGLIAGPNQENGVPMYGHGFGMMFLASVYGMETDPRNREQLAKVINGAIGLTARGQSRWGGWTYIPGGGDEGSVTVTQVQALRAAHNAGFTVPKGTIEESIRYLERCRTPEGGISYSLGSGGGARLAISCGALAAMYNAGEYDSPMSEACLAYVFRQFSLAKGQWSRGGGHDYYAHLYASQAFYQAGDKYWDDYFPGARDQMLKQQQADGSWTGDGIGPVYGTAIALTILQLPYKFLPIYQR